MISCSGLDSHITVCGWAQEFVYNFMGSIYLVLSFMNLWYSLTLPPSPPPPPPTPYPLLSESWRGMDGFSLYAFLCPSLSWICSQGLSGRRENEDPAQKPQQGFLLLFLPPPPCPSHSQVLFGPQFLWLEKIPFSQGTCLGIAALRCSWLPDLTCLGTMAEERKKPRGFPLSLSCYPPSPPGTHTHAQAPIHSPHTKIRSLLLELFLFMLGTLFWQWGCLWSRLWEIEREGKSS